MSTQHNNSNFYLFLAIIAILYHVNSTETSVKDIHKILAHQRLVEPTVEKHQSLAQVSDIIGRFDTFEKRFDALVEKVALKSPSEKREAVESSNNGNESENLTNSCSNTIDIESRKAEEEALKVVDEALKAEEEALKAMEKLQNVKQ